MKLFKTIRLIYFAVCLVLLVAVPGLSQRTTFNDVRVRLIKSSSDRTLSESNGKLRFDDPARKLIVESSGKPLQIGYDDVSKVVFDNIFRSPKKNAAKDIGYGTATDIIRKGGPLGRVIGAGVDGRSSAKAFNDLRNYWMYIELRTPGGGFKPILIEMKQDDSTQVMSKAQQVFGNKVHIPEFPQLGHEIDKKTLREANVKHSVTVAKKNLPDPQINPNKALLVVVCPISGTVANVWQFKLHANDSIVIVNRPGTYSFAYLDPGEYTLASQAGFAGGNANGLTLNVEAGKDYYFLQNIVESSNTLLSRNAKEIVMFELQGSYYSNWKRISN